MLFYVFGFHIQIGACLSEVFTNLQHPIQA